MCVGEPIGLGEENLELLKVHHGDRIFFEGPEGFPCADDEYPMDKVSHFGVGEIASKVGRVRNQNMRGLINVVSTPVRLWK